MLTGVTSEPGEGQLDAHCTSGTSPTAAPAHRVATSGTLHLLGPGSVGRELLRQIARSGRRLVAVTDRTATIAAPAGIDPLRVCAWKEAGRQLAEWPGAWAVPANEAVSRVGAGIVVDCTSTAADRPEWPGTLDGVLERGSAIALAAKDALASRAAEWLVDGRGQVGCNAVLGGTGQAFVGALPELRRRWCEVAIVGNASTTTIIECIEGGGTVEAGLEEARRHGYLESDPELDLRGCDAAVKLAIVAGALLGERIDPDTIACEDIRNLDPGTVRSRATRGATTRLVARLSKTGLHVGYEEISLHSALAARPGRVIYCYDLNQRERRLQVGGGLGAAATAAALWLDVIALGAAQAYSRAVTAKVAQ